MTITTLTSTLQPTYNPNIVCGICNHPAKYHRQGTNACDRDMFEVGNLYDERIVGDDTPYAADTLNGEILTNYAGPGTITEGYDRWDTNPEISDGWDSAYRDKDSHYERNAKGQEVSVPNDLAITLDEYRNDRRVGFSEPIRNGYVEGSTGYLIQEVFNPDLTEKYAFRVLNLYKDKQGNQRCGSVQIRTNTDQTVTVKCVKCHQEITSRLDYTREEMETFTLSIIRHGNNHAAYWFTSRPEFYKVHAEWCDINKCHPKAINCPVKEVTEDDVKALAATINTSRS